MRLVVAALLAILAACAAWFSVSLAQAQATPATLFVSGLHIDSAKSTAFVHISNTSRLAADFYTVQLFLYHADGNRAGEPGGTSQLLLPGRTMSIDVASVVRAYRSANGLGSFAGAVQLVVYGQSCADLGTCAPGAVPRPFGPALIHVETQQTEGAAVFEAAVQWRNGENQ